MKEWLTAGEMAAAQLPGLPSSGRSIRRHAHSKNWHQRGVPVKGLLGGRRAEYHVNNLTEAQREALAKYEEASLAAARGAVTVTPKRPGEGAIPDGESSDGAAASAIILPEKVIALPGSSADEVARESLWAGFAAASRAKQTAAAKLAAALRLSVELMRNGNAKMAAYKLAGAAVGLNPNTIRARLPQVSGFDSADWAPILLDKRAGRQQPTSYSSRIDDLFRADFLRAERPSAQSCFDRIAPIAAREGLAVPKLITIMRHLRRDLSWQAVAAARYGRKALEATFPAQSRDRGSFRAMEALCADGHTFDVMVEWPDGVKARPCIVSWIDLYSGAVVGWRIGQTENLDLVRLSFGDTLDFGLTDEVFLDNGMGFAAHWMSGRIKHRFRFKLMPDEPAGIFELLGIQVHWALPHHGQSKPIERLHREFADRIARHPKFSGSWLGPSPVDQPENRGTRAIPIGLFTQVVEQEIAAINARPGRRSRNCAGRSFWATFEESYAKGPIRKATEEQRRLFLLAVQNVMISKRDGTFKIFGDNRYYNSEIARLAGERLTARFDPQNLHAPVYIYRLDGGYLGSADCILPVGFSDTEAAREHARRKRQNVKMHRAILANEKRMDTGELAALLPDSPSSPELPSSKVIRLFRPKLEAPRAPVADEIEREPAQSESERQFEEYKRLKAMPAAALSGEDEIFIRVFESKPAYKVRKREGLVA